MKFPLHKVKNQYLKDSDKLKVNRWEKRIKQHLPAWEKVKIEDMIKIDKVINRKENAS